MRPTTSICAAGSGGKPWRCRRCFPYYVTGAITASGGSWNAAFLAEYTSWGSTQVTAHGIGAYLAEASAAGNFHGIVLGTVVMCLFVVVINRFFWRPLYYYAERRYRLA